MVRRPVRHVVSSRCGLVHPVEICASDGRKSRSGLLQWQSLRQGAEIEVQESPPSGREVVCPLEPWAGSRVASLMVCGTVACLALASAACSGLGANEREPTELSGQQDAASESPGSEQVLTDEPHLSVSCDGFTVVPSEGRLLTRLQYVNTVVDLFDGRISPPVVGGFPAENEVLGFRNNAESHRATPLLAEAHMEVAEQVAAAAVVQIDSILPCAMNSPDLECAETFIDTIGQRAFRRPLREGERQLFLDLFATSEAELGFERSIGLMVEALLQSPQFLYRFEFGGAALEERSLVEGDVTGYGLTDYEMASRLSYFLYNSMPDDELFEAAAAGRLTTVEQIEAQARRMIDSPKAAVTISDFHDQWLGLERLKSVARVAPGFEQDELAVSWKTSLDKYFRHVFFGAEANFANLMQSEAVFLDGTLAGLYGASVPSGLAPGEFFQAEPAASGSAVSQLGQRGGLLTQPGLLALLSHPDQSSPILRGVFVREDVLCDQIPAPPPNVDQTPPDPDPNSTTRERFQVHTEDEACAGCHSLIDPLGLGFERYDHLGRYRETENELPIDDTGVLTAVSEQSIEGPFTGAAELAARLSESEQVKACLATQWYRYALGRVEQAADRCSIDQVMEHFGQDGDLKELLVGIVVSDAFQARGVDAASLELPSAE